MNISFSTTNHPRYSSATDTDVRRQTHHAGGFDVDSTKYSTGAAADSAADPGHHSSGIAFATEFGGDAAIYADEYAADSSGKCNY